MNFLSSLGRMFGGQRSPSLAKAGINTGWGDLTGGMGASPVSDQPYLQGPTSLGPNTRDGGQMSELAGLFGGGSPAWNEAPQMMKPEGGGFDMGQIGQAAGGMAQMLGQQEQQQQQYQPSWFGQFQPMNFPGRRY